MSAIVASVWYGDTDAESAAEITVSPSIRDGGPVEIVIPLDLGVFACDLAIQVNAEQLRAALGGAT